MYIEKLQEIALCNCARLARQVQRAAHQKGKVRSKVKPHGPKLLATAVVSPAKKKKKKKLKPNFKTSLLI